LRSAAAPPVNAATVTPATANAPSIGHDAADFTYCDNFEFIIINLLGRNVMEWPWPDVGTKKRGSFSNLR
jgi:hypothetical protein